MALMDQEMAGGQNDVTSEAGPICSYEITGLPAGEHALIAEFPHQNWRVLRWNDEWHGNWSRSYPSAAAALDALGEQILIPAHRLTIT